MAETKITEKYEYLTDILTSYSGNEQRLSLREIPRHYLSYNYDAINSGASQWLKAQLRERQTDVTFVPMWQNVTYLSVDFPTGKALYVDEDFFYYFDNCDAIEIFQKDDIMGNTGINLQKLVYDYDDIGEINLKTSIDRKLDMRNTFVVPLIRCATQKVDSFSYPFSNGGSTVMNFADTLYQTKKNIPIKYISGFDYNIEGFNIYNIVETYNNRDVFLVEPQWDSDTSLTFNVDKHYFDIDNKSGIFKYDLKSNSSYDTHNITVLLSTKKMITNMIKFFKLCKGRFKSFYCPSWVNDFDIVKDIGVGSNTIYTRLNDLYRYYSSNTRKKKIIIFTNDCKSYIYDILTYATEDIDGVKYGKIILGSSVKKYLPVTNIVMTSFFNLVRFDSDELVINYETCSIATTTLVMKEVDDQ